MKRRPSSASGTGSEADARTNIATRDLRADRRPSALSRHGLDWLNFLLADVQTGVGPFLAIYLAGRGWNEQRVGIALTIGGLAGIAAQTPAGAIVDRFKSKRALIAAGVIALAIGALSIALFPAFWPVVAAQILIGAMSTFFMPAIAAISLGIVGHRLFNRRVGRNQTFNSAGNVAAAAAMGLIGYFISNRGVFLFVGILAIPTILSLWLIRPGEIDYQLARGAGGDMDGPNSATVLNLLKDRPLIIFLGCAVLFHFANAAMLPLLGEMLARGKGRASMMFMSACVVTTQFTIALIAAWVGRGAAAWGRKPLLLIGFGVLPIRGVLYILTHNLYLLVGIQVFDGIGAAIFGVVSILVIADLTRGTGRFNLTLGAIATAVGIGAALSQTIAGVIVHHFGDHAGFLFLASVAAAAFAILWCFMPETLEQPGEAPAPASRAKS
ncbi:MAG: MFS transporter [Candidatus Binataceae bacterium]|nr:MFS transporter [Candidatus Binataceae bacterium]